jgi:hypothetical protein
VKNKFALKIIGSVCVFALVFLDGCSSMKNMGIDDFGSDSSFSLKSHYASMSLEEKGVLVGGATGLLLSSAVPLTYPVGLTMGVISGGAVGKYMTTHSTQLEKLQHHHIGVMHLGDFVKVTIPADLVFDGNGKIRHTSLLDEVADFIRPMMVKEYMTVDAYLAGYGEGESVTNFARHEAVDVMRYLEYRRVDARIIVANAYANMRPVMADPMAPGNHRIEINFQLMHT